MKFDNKKHSEIQGDVLFNKIYSRSHFKAEITFADLKGNLKRMMDKDDIFTSSYLSIEREQLILIKIQREKIYLCGKKIPQEVVTYVPLLRNDVIMNSKVKGQLVYVLNEKYVTEDFDEEY